MLRIHFKAEDLARVRMVATVGLVAEGVFALDVYGRRTGGPIAEWRRSVRNRLGKQVSNVDGLIREHRPLSDLLWLIRWSNEPTGVFGHPDLNRRHVAETVFEFCRAAVAPYWSQARGYLEAERDARARIAITSGVERLLSTLHPRMHWNPPVLEIAHSAQRDIYLSGRGLRLSPSVFLPDKTCVVVDESAADRRPTVVFSTTSSLDLLSGLTGADEPDEHALGALVGYTRAAALQALTDSCTTGELSQRLGISLAGASKHARVLRHAGLVTTARHRNTALHSLTPLGVALLRNPVKSRPLVLDRTPGRP